MQLLVYGQGQVIPNSFKTIKPNLKYSFSVNLSTDVEYGRVVLVTDKYFCRDAAGNQFMRTTGSRFLVHFGETDFIKVKQKILNIQNCFRILNSVKNPVMQIEYHKKYIES